MLVVSGPLSSRARRCPPLAWLAIRSRLLLPTDVPLRMLPSTSQEADHHQSVRQYCTLRRRPSWQVMSLADESWRCVRKRAATIREREHLEPSRRLLLF